MLSLSSGNEARFGRHFATTNGVARPSRSNFALDSDFAVERLYEEPEPPLA